MRCAFTRSAALAREASLGAIVAISRAAMSCDAVWRGVMESCPTQGPTVTGHVSK